MEMEQQREMVTNGHHQVNRLHEPMGSRLYCRRRSSSPILRTGTEFYCWNPQRRQLGWHTQTS